MVVKIAPLPGTFMIMSIVGFVSSVLVLPSMPFSSAESFSFAFALVFVLMFIASLLSMHYAPIGEITYEAEEKKVKKKRKS